MAVCWYASFSHSSSFSHASSIVFLPSTQHSSSIVFLPSTQHSSSIVFLPSTQVRFFTVPDCVCAQQKMHGRFFAKRQILTEYLTPEDFDQLKKETGK
jgi:hypothetical protein